MSEKDSDKAPSNSSATAPRSKKKLGRGLGALMGDAQREEPLVQSIQNKSAQKVDPNSGPRIVADVVTSDRSADNRSSTETTIEGLSRLPISALEPNPDQPRTQFDEGALDELAASIASRGVIQPVIVRPMAGGTYQIVAGERRWRASQKAQLHEIPVLIRDLSDREVIALALIENLQREDLNPVEEARAYHRLSEEEGLTQAEIAKMVDKSRSHVANTQRLLALPEGVLTHLATGVLSMGHARALIGLDDAEALADQAVRKKLSVREVEQLARSNKPGRPGRKSAAGAAGDSTQNADIAAVQNHLEEFLGMPVRINADTDPRSGAVTIRYRTLDQLDLVCQRLTGGAI